MRLRLQHRALAELSHMIIDHAPMDVIKNSFPAACSSRRGEKKYEYRALP